MSRNDMTKYPYTEENVERNEYIYEQRNLGRKFTDIERELGLYPGTAYKVYWRMERRMHPDRVAHDKLKKKIERMRRSDGDVV